MLAEQEDGLGFRGTSRKFESDMWHFHFHPIVPYIASYQKKRPNTNNFMTIVDVCKVPVTTLNKPFCRLNIFRFSWLHPINEFNLWKSLLFG